VLAVACAAVGCSGAHRGRLVAGVGTYALEGSLELRVTAQGMTLVAYELRDTAQGDRVIAGDVVGRDTSRWFLYYDQEDRLWVHSNDIGTEVWVPTLTGEYRKHSVFRGGHFALDMPVEVAQRLPQRTRRSLGIAAADTD
jgi:hypothetical protein